jgi:glycosyltransferase involved in cell wall biosynthesis
VKVVFVEASSGSVVGGSLTGMLELLRGIDRARITPSVVLYEHKPCIGELRERGIPVTVVSRRVLPKTHALQESTAYAGARNVRAVASALQLLRRSATFAAETLPSALRLRAAMAPFAPDLVYACNGFRGNSDAIVAARLVGVPCVIHAKGFDKLSWIERLLSASVAGCISMTKAIEDHCRAGGMRPGFFEVIYDGLDLAAFRPKRASAEVRRELGLAADCEVAGVVGNIQPWKGQKVLVEALDLLAAEKPALVVLIVGGTHRSGAAYEREVRELVAARGLASRVVFTGPRADVPDLMNAMDVLVHTSVRGEPFGRVIIEGMAVARPVIATRAGGVPEFVHDGDDAVLVEPGDAPALARELAVLLGDPARRETLGRAARVSAERFALPRHVALMSRAFERATAGRDAALHGRAKAAA